MTSFGDWRDNDGIAPGDNLHGPPDPGFQSSYYSAPQHRALFNDNTGQVPIPYAYRAPKPAAESKDRRGLYALVSVIALLAICGALMLRFVASH